MADIPDLPPVLEQLLESGGHDAIGAYVLDALPPAERLAFEEHLATCDQCQGELTVLKQSADVLLRALVPSAAVARPAESASGDPPADPQTPDRDSAPEIVETEDRPIEESVIEAEPSSESVAEPETTVESAEPIETAASEPETASEPSDAPEPKASRRRSRSRGRIAPGLAAEPEDQLAGPGTPQSKLPYVLAAIGGLVGLAGFVAALAFAEMRGNLQDEIDFQNQRINELVAQREAYQDNTEAVVFTLNATTLGVPESTAVIFADPAGTSAVLAASGMAPLGADQTYQVWYIPLEGPAIPGPTFGVDETGAATLLLEPDLSQLQAVAITIEPAGGSQEATTDPVIQGFVSG
ncbi:hypothetical protein BH23CHL5_BH23CHL5_27350 [soil metagenome]